MRSPALDQNKFGAYITPPAGGAAREVWRARVKELCKDITLTELFSLPIGPRQKYIEILTQTRSESEGFVIRSTAGDLSCRVKQTGDPIVLTEEPRKVSISEGLQIFGKFGLYLENEMESSFRAGAVVEVLPTHKIQQETAAAKLARAEQMLIQAQAMFKEAKEQAEKSAAPAKKNPTIDRKRKG